LFISASFKIYLFSTLQFLLQVLGELFSHRLGFGTHYPFTKSS
jgi:hypothetical protein